MNISKIYRLLVLFFLMLFFTFSAQLYVNFKNYLNQTKENFKVAVFLKDTQLQKDEVINIVSQKSSTKSVEYVDKDIAYQKALEISPELNNIVENKEISYPAYILLNNLPVFNEQNLESMVNSLFSLDFVDDVCYDKTMFNEIVKNIELFNIYTYIIIILFSLLLIIYIFKTVLFCIKQEYKTIFSNIAEALIITIFAYALICFCSVIKNDSIFILNWEILIVLFPVSMIINFINVQSNVKN